MPPEFSWSPRAELKNNNDGLSAKSIEFEWLIFNVKHEYEFDLGHAMRLS